MARDDQLRFGPLKHAVHICVDMQRLFAEATDWKTPWLDRVLPRVRHIVERHAEKTIFTRFIPAVRPDDGFGTWRRYYRVWQSMTLERLGADMADLVPHLASFVPPAEIVDKRIYSPWIETDLRERLRRRDADTLVITGCETEVCVLATVLGAVDLGYRVVVATDALCSSSDETHDALLAVYRRRFGQQIEAVPTHTILEHWR